LTKKTWEIFGLKKKKVLIGLIFAFSLLGKFYQIFDVTKLKTIKIMLHLQQKN
jgi:hypothetical protein